MIEKYPGRYKKSQILKIQDLPKMSRKVQQNTKIEDYFSKFSSQRCKATEALRDRTRLKQFFNYVVRSTLSFFSPLGRIIAFSGFVKWLCL